MINKKLKNEILRSVTLVVSVLVVGITLTACQSSVGVGKKVKLPSDSNPLLTKKQAQADFAYPTKKPSVAEGKPIFKKNCAVCHGFNDDSKDYNFTKDYVNKVTPSHLFKAITSDKKHPSFKDKLSIKERWDAVMYLRFEVFGLPNDFKDIQTKFGSNCAVCHGTRGHADGSLHYYLNPPPANFTQFDRLYERTDEKIFDEISNGIAWTAMPPWANRVDKDKHFTFDEDFRWELVKYVRHFGYVTEKDILREEKYFKGEGK